LRTFEVVNTCPAISQRGPLVKATGGVYKGQGLIPRSLMNHKYEAFLVEPSLRITNDCPHCELTILENDKRTLRELDNYTINNYKQ